MEIFQENTWSFFSWYSMLSAVWKCNSSFFQIQSNLSIDPYSFYVVHDSCIRIQSLLLRIILRLSLILQTSNLSRALFINYDKLTFIDGYF